MIKGFSKTPIAPMLEKGSRSADLSSSSAKKAEKADFADQLFGAKSGKLEGPETRTEQKKPGRESEGSRSGGREKTDSQSAETRAPKKAEGKVERKPLAKKDSPRAEAQETDRPQTINREPIAVADRPMTERPISDEVASVETPVEGTKGAQPSQVSQTAAPSAAPVKGSVPTDKSPKAGVQMPDFFSKTAIKGEAPATAPAIPQDPTAVQAATSAAMLAGMQMQGATDRQAAMTEFLTKMETELGVPPEKVLQAFSEMDLDSLTETPQNAIGAFVEGLELEPAGQVRATELYKNLLDKRGDAILDEKLGGLSDDVSFDIVSPRDQSLRKLDKSLNDLNATFFRKDGKLAQDPESAQKALESMDAQLSKLMRERDDKTAKRGQSEIALMGAAGAAGAFAAKEAVEGGEAASMASESGDTLSSMTSSISDTSIAKLPDLGGGSSSNDMMGGQGEKQGESKSQTVATPQNVEFKDSVSKEMKATDKKAPSLRAEQSLESATSTTPTAPGQAATPKAPIGAAGAAVGAGTGEMMMGRQPTAADEQQNIREMVKHAQVMLKRGGGEMKISMTPEGMGQVHLKVAVENGQVNIQMLTETESSKRLLEKGLGDLKSSMAAQQLKVENVRVDVGQEIQKHMDQQAGQEQSRNFAREFMQQQRDDRQGMREGAFAMRGLGSYGGNKRAPLEPEAVQGASARAAARSSGRGLNLVA
ncbi:MAG: flagellar hook-length control protein FliK [Bdellovibrionota bacterium]